MFVTVVLTGLVCLSVLQVSADDWPTRLRDARRGGVTAEQLTVPLTEQWCIATSRAPGPAWPESPARHDGFHGYYNMKRRQNYDPCFDVAVVSNRLYFGSSDSGAITCADVADGQAIWVFFTDGPVRFAPHVVNGKVYVGSDDGYVYCLNAVDGELVWKERAGPTGEMIWGNSRMISVWPVRGSPVVVDDSVFWTAGYFPEEGMYVCKRNAADGTGGWTVAAQKPPQGYLVAGANRLFVPTGKTYPNVYDPADGDYLGAIGSSGGDGGCWALLTPDESDFWSGPSLNGRHKQYNAGTRSYIGYVSGANYLIADSTYAYYSTDSQLIKIYRNNRLPVWTRSYTYPNALIMAGDALFAGGNGEVAAFDVSDGDRLWTSAVDGSAYGLAVADGRLYVSTDAGSIYCFFRETPFITNCCASNVAVTSADLLGHLVSTGGGATEVYAFWGTNDALAVRNDWGNTNYLGTNSPGMLICGLTSIASNTTYYYRFYATNSCGEHWSDSSASFKTYGLPTVNNTGATGLGSTTARLNGNLTGGAEAHIYIYWGATDGGTNKANWSHTNDVGTVSEGVFSCSLSGLDPTTTYHYRCYASNFCGTAWADSTTNFTTPSALLEDWCYRLKITFAGHDKAGTLTNFPALVVLGTNISGFSYAQFASVCGDDLRFADVTETNLLSYEIEEWNTNGASCVWVQVPKISGTNTCIWAYWGASEKDPPASCTNGATWAQDYVLVWHLGEPSGATAPDSSANELDGTVQGMEDVDWVPGQISRGLQFDGTVEEYVVRQPFSGFPAANITAAYWVKTGDSSDGIVSYASSASANDFLIFNGGSMTLYRGSSSLDTGIAQNDNGWHHIAVTWKSSGGNIALYRDGILKYEGVFVAGTSITDGGAFILAQEQDSVGGGFAGGQAFSGVLDEIRVSEVVRSSNWVWACWLNAASNSAFSGCGFVTPTGADADDDGIADGWELYHFGSITNVDETTDTDHDGFGDYCEFVAGTDPINPNDFLSIVDAAVSDVLGHVIKWSSVSSKSYSLDRSTNLTDGLWPALASNILATPPVNIYTVDQNNARSTFYRIDIEQD